jgi:hypothetical protein
LRRNKRSIPENADKFLVNTLLSHNALRKLSNVLDTRPDLFGPPGKGRKPFKNRHCYLLKLLREEKERFIEIAAGYNIKVNYSDVDTALLRSLQVSEDEDEEQEQQETEGAFSPPPSRAITPPPTAEKQAQPATMPHNGHYDRLVELNFIEKYSIDNEGMMPLMVRNDMVSAGCRFNMLTLLDFSCLFPLFSPGGRDHHRSRQGGACDRHQDLQNDP